MCAIASDRWTIEQENNMAENLDFIFTPNDFDVDTGDDRAFDSFTYWQKRFTDDKFQALYELGFNETVSTVNKTPSFNFLYLLAENFIEFLTNIPEIELIRGKLTADIPEDIKHRLLNSIPFAIGAEFITEDWLNRIFTKLVEIFNKEITKYVGTVAQYFSEKRQGLKIPERIFFHLVENKRSKEYPFAFMATYATTAESSDVEGLDSKVSGKVRHMPLAYALKEFKDDHQKLLSLLSCLNRAAVVSPLISSFIDTGEMLHPLKLTSEEAYELLKSIPALEKQGILCRIPNWWKKRTSSVKLSVKFEEKSKLGVNSLVSMLPELSVDGVELNEKDIEDILQQTDGLSFIKGKWVEVDKKRLHDLIDKMNEYSGDISFFEAMRLKAGLDAEDEEEITFSNEDFLGETIKKLCNANKIRKPKIPSTVQATLRPYQVSGYAWLNLMSELGLGACLADDMGLGKTLEVLTFLAKLRQQDKNAKILLIVPASLLGNWESETKRFTPNIPIHILHGRGKPVLEQELKEPLSFLTVTTYATAAGLEGLQKIDWSAVILDEAQAIKNADTKQTKMIKKIPAGLKIAMTGTPVENNLSNLWSLFDFLNKGLLGSANEFRKFTKQIEEIPHGYQKLRNIVSPFILRRLKTDKSIISDLPDKMEMIDYVTLSSRQIVLYHKAVEDFREVMENRELSKFRRSGLILETLTQLKQICNHPDQYLDGKNYTPSDSGKFEMLREICETIHENREKVLIFTQFKKIVEYLAEYLSGIFHRQGLIIHGDVTPEKRTKLVETFNTTNHNPFMLLSLKTAGVGLNLVGANHVIHFDRWWNPAVENQATDRAFRIGQTKNVFVHKFVAKGTIEERINDMLESKKSLAENVIGSGENWITELSNQEILDMMRLAV